MDSANIGAAIATRSFRAKSALQKVKARDSGSPAERYASQYHAPVLCQTVIEGLVTDESGVYVDATLGGGGHTAALLDTLGSDAMVIGIDQDAQAIAQSRERLSDSVESGRLRLVQGNFLEIANLVQSVTDEPVDGVLFDFGVSSHQLDTAERGFSHRMDAPLDMRMDQNADFSADQIVNGWPVSELVQLFRRYGEEPRARPIAQAIVAARPVDTTGQLATLIRSAVPLRHEAKSVARIFQAIRIGTNAEIDVLERALNFTPSLIKEHGRLVAISYHSLEDRRVKRFMRSGNFEGNLMRDLRGNAIAPFRELTRKPIAADEHEVAVNPRARSARLRIAERTAIEPSRT